MLSFIHSFQSEWLKKKRSLSSIIVYAGAFFIPAIMTLVALVKHDGLAETFAGPGFWLNHWDNAWNSMATFLLPLGVILLTSLVAQIEYKNNTWKQLHTLPLTFTTVFFSKLAVIMAMMVQFFLLFNIGIYLSVVIPSFLVSGVPYPPAHFPFLHFVKENLYYFVDCLPIIALQYLLSLRFRNFLAPVGIGFLLLVGSLIGLMWEYSYTIPYTYSVLHATMPPEMMKIAFPGINIHLLAGCWFVLITAASYFLFLRKKEKG